MLITGASGWLGRETICYLTQLLEPRYFPKLVLSGKTTRTIDIHGAKYEITALNELTPDEKYDLIIHFAFVTQEKLKKVGTTEYISENLQLNERVQGLSESSGQCKNLVISSGAAEMYSDDEFSKTSKGIYGNLKRDLEGRFMNSESLILRLWTLSGHHLGKNPNYALSEFIGCATKDTSINIRENVSRTYVSAPDVIHASINYLLQGGSGIANSGGEFTTLSDLAETVVSVTKSQSKIVAPAFRANHPENYVSPATEIPAHFWKQKKSLYEQVSETASNENFSQNS